MNPIRKKYERTNINTEDKDKGQVKINESRSNHNILETKYEKPYSRKRVEEQNVESGKEPSKNRIENLPKTTLRYKGINNYRRDNNVDNNTIPNEKLKEVDINKNKEITHYYSIKSTTNTSKPNNKWNTQEVKIEKEQPKWGKYRATTEKEIPKEENINYRSNNVYISKYIKEGKNEINNNVESNTITKSIVVQSRRRNKPEEKEVKTEINVIKTRNEAKKTNEIKNIQNDNILNMEKNKDNKNNYKNY